MSIIESTDQTASERQREAILLDQLPFIDPQLLVTCIRWAQFQSKTLDLRTMKHFLIQKLYQCTYPESRDYAIQVMLSHRFGIAPHASILQDLEMFDGKAAMSYAIRAIPQHISFWLPKATPTTDIDQLAYKLGIKRSLALVSILWAVFVTHSWDQDLHSEICDLIHFLQIPNETGCLPISSIFVTNTNDDMWLQDFGKKNISHLPRPFFQFQSIGSLHLLQLDDVGVWLDTRWDKLQTTYFHDPFFTNMFRLYAAYPHLQFMHL